MRILLGSSLLLAAGMVLADAPSSMPDTPLQLATFDTGSNPEVDLVVNETVLAIQSANADLTVAENLQAIRAA